MPATSLIDPNDPPDRQTEKLLKIASALMRRVEEGSESTGAAYAQFQRAALLEEEVRARTRDLEQAMELLNTSNAMLAEATREAELARTNLANAIETVQEGFALFDAHERLVLCNSRFGMHMPDIRDRLQPGLSFQGYVRLVSESQHLSLPEGETPDRWRIRRMERHRDDHVIFNVRMIWNRWVQVSEHRTADGGTVILQTDVTDIMRVERQERERLLDDQARLIRATLDHMDQGVCIFDAKGRLAGWNRRLAELLHVPIRRLHLSTEAVRLLEWVEEQFDFSGGLTAATVASWIAARSGRDPLTFEIRRGPEVLNVFGQEMPDGGFVISFTDVSAERAAVAAIREANETLEARVAARTLELRAALAEAERANASKSRFVAAASHDLLQPLSAAKLYLSSIAADEGDPETSEILSKTGRALQSVESILDALLDISKLDSGLATVHVGPTPLGAILARLEEELGPVARRKGLELRIVPCSAVTASDSTYLRRILQNLISNAVRYTRNGKVLVGVRRRGDGIRVEVWDTGPGIPEDKRQVIFGEFQRLEAAASPSEGMGLGLAIVERACALLDHRLTLVSEVGRGSGFLVDLPLADACQDDLDHPSTAQPEGPDRLAGRLALLVENDADFRQALTILLEKWGADVIAVASRDEALSLLAEVGLVPDLVIADFQLDDGLRGTEAIATLRAEYGPLPACIVTADRGPEVQLLCDALSVPVIPKPIDPGFLAGQLSQVLGD